MFKYNFLVKFLFFLRDLLSPELFQTLRTHCHGIVLDVGGASFFETAIKKNISFQRWIVLEGSINSRPEKLPSNVEFILGDGTQMSFPNEQFDTVLNIQVLEHTFDPFLMFQECVRVLKKGGIAIFMAPQTATMHLAPYHYQNFLRFWFYEAAKRTNVEILSLTPLGGWWRSQASRTFYFFLSAFRRSGSSNPECRRNIWFYFLFPLMCVYAVLNIPICMLMSLGDLTEEPPNHVFVIRKK